MFELRSFIAFLLIFDTCSYPLQCPDISQRQLRETGYCTSSLKSEYSCLYDTYWLWFSEQCNKNPDYVTPGEKYVISGGLRNVECSSIHYQPFPLWSNVSGECLYQKSQCKEEGQVLYNNGSHISDGTCRCDNTNGYKFIRQPKQNFFCMPSEEDCSCYFTKCPNCSVLSSDYECEEKPETDSKCPPIEIESSGIWQRQNMKSFIDKQEQPRMPLIVVGTMFVLVLAYTVIVSVLWEKIPQIDYNQGRSHNLENLIDIYSTPKSDSSTTVKPTSEKTPQLTLNETTLEKTILQHENIVKSKDAKIAELEQLLEQTHKEITKIEIVKKDQEKEMEKRDKEIKRKEYEIKQKTDDITCFEIERKKLHNQIQEFKGNIRVFCRVRPLLDGEKRGNNCKLDHISFPGPNEIDVVKTKNAKTNEKGKPSKFSFDKVFTYDATQDQVFEEISQLVQSALDGYNVCIFAYGQTGSGKTYTMEGTSVKDNTDDVNRGMIPRSVLQIFDTIRKLTIEGWTYSVDASCLEIYGKEINDLLCDKKGGPKPKIKDVKNETLVTNITIARVTSEKEVYMLLQKASNNRTEAETINNQRSSRSHSVFTLKITGENVIADVTKKSTLYLVDLAGSERIKTSGVEGQQMKEAVAINQSLNSLGRVIRAVKGKVKVIPYRDTVLTYLLQHSIGGNSKTLLFVNISPHEDCVEETLNSLKFATEANKCKIGVAQKNR